MKFVQLVETDFQMYVFVLYCHVTLNMHAVFITSYLIFFILQLVTLY